MTLRHYKIFVAVCDTMNMTSAAETLFMSQSAVSQAIAELENHYGVRLFERLSRKLFLTQAGQKLLGYARHMIHMNAEVENDMKTLHQNGTIRIGASVTVGAHVLPGLVSDFKKTKPLTDIEVIEDNTARIENLILQDKIDIGLVEGETTSPDVRNRAFMDDELVLICSANHRFAAYPVIEPKELEKEDFIIREKGSGTRKTFEEKMTENNLTWKVSWTCNNADTIKMAVAAGLGVSVISKRAVVSEIASGLLCSKYVKDMEFKRQFKIIYHKNKYLTDSMKQFMTLL
ncbi:LysR family transcriptional regulator [Caproiciproducens galactitolivorans]|uniref:LysR family transcriptional regulator n=1 Tax=Caproiciproducens galactitolivorans TaxID=642589 RepID=A0ABT4BV45_9FIRM|nr:LysR family transcriptional regulator [Caproiciproducens galactitolivorans]MCY1714772.1 LysR family transcriptional regulator [Caproiciproducens galactitolivorans]